MRDKDIIGIDNGYTVNELGEVKYLNKLCSTDTNGRGYKRAFIKVNGMKTSRNIHRLVAEAFLLNPNHLPVVNHIDGNKLNNCVENLEWVTQSENIIKALVANPRKTKPIAQIKNGKVISVFFSINQASQLLGLSYRSIFEALKNTKAYKGYMWVYCIVDVELERLI